MPSNEEVKQECIALGFDLVGIANANDPALDIAQSRYSDWLTLGFSASMDYLARHESKKADPQLFFEGTRSFLCVGLLYGAATQLAHHDETRALVSLYTRGRDYHLEMQSRLKQLAEVLASKYSIQSRIFTDAEPVFERFWAWRAGLGWLGKNTMLINRKVGSYFFIGGLALDHELNADEPGLDHCGKCRKCIDACPTEAITDERFIDSNKCIGFHTIENKSVIPINIMENSGRWIAGCDICQNVCPWNDPVTPGNNFETTNPIFDAPLEALSKWTQIEFKQRMETVAMGRMRYSGFLRNLTVAISHSSLNTEKKTQCLNRIKAATDSIQSESGKKGVLAALEWASSVIIFKK
jgi:epoxyqueuosine reductase